MKKAIVVGATSGIGRETAKVLAQNGYIVGMAGRRMTNLLELQQEIPTQIYVKQIDVTKTETAIEFVKQLINELGGLDVMVLCAGVVNPNLELDWNKDQATIAVNVNGFVALADLTANFFNSQGSGHLVGISSMSALVHSPKSTVYCASKASVSNYLKGLRVNLESSHGKGRIFVTEVLPGWVYTEMTAKADPAQIFWPTTAAKAAVQIMEAIHRRKKLIYIAKRWRIIAWMIKALPEKWRIKK